MRLPPRDDDARSIAVDPKRSPLKEASKKAYSVTVIWLFFSAGALWAITDETISQGYRMGRLVLLYPCMMIYVVFLNVRLLVLRSRAKAGAADEVSGQEDRQTNGARIRRAWQRVLRSFFVVALASPFYVAAWLSPGVVPAVLANAVFLLIVVTCMHFGIQYTVVKGRAR